MLPDLEKYIGHTVEMIYIDRNQRITQRKVKLHLIENNEVKGFCLNQWAPRLFKKENILAVSLELGRRLG